MTIRLPQVPSPAPASLPQTLADRRSLREYAKTEIELRQLAQLLWATQTITGEQGQRVTPSAGAQYPMEVLVVAGLVADTVAGLYRYHPDRHELEGAIGGDIRAGLCAAALEQQPWVEQAPVTLALVADLDAISQMGIRFAGKTSDN